MIIPAKTSHQWWRLSIILDMDDTRAKQTKAICSKCFHSKDGELPTFFWMYIYKVQRVSQTARLNGSFSSYLPPWKQPWMWKAERVQTENSSSHQKWRVELHYWPCYFARIWSRCRERIWPRFDCSLNWLADKCPRNEVLALPPKSWQLH